MGHTCGKNTARFPIWSCSRRGLPCRRVLPPARCALTAPFHPYRPHPNPPPLAGEGRVGGRRFTFCCTFRGLAPPRRYLAPCPGSPDFPPRLRAAVVWPTPARMLGVREEGSKRGGRTKGRKDEGTKRASPSDFFRPSVLTPLRPSVLTSRPYALHSFLLPSVSPFHTAPRAFRR